MWDHTCDFKSPMLGKNIMELILTANHRINCLHKIAILGWNSLCYPMHSHPLASKNQQCLVQRIHLIFMQEAVKQNQDANYPLTSGREVVNLTPKRSLGRTAKQQWVMELMGPS